MSKHVETAFPCHGPSGQVFEYGLTKREWFAGMALQGALSSPDQPPGTTYAEKRDKLCEICVEYADAMLAALAEKGGDQ